MAEEGEVEMIDSTACGAGPPNQSSTPETGVLVKVAFQKDLYHKYKYLESEPKALGTTQIMLSLFVLSTRLATLRENLKLQFIFGNLTLFGLIAGSVAIAAQNLHLPTLKACFGVQVVMCVLSVTSFISSMNLLLTHSVTHACWYENVTSEIDMCNRLQPLFDHTMGLEMLVQATQIALSVTLAAFCCKVIQCCNPQPSMPVIAVNTPQAPE
ncbi:uncharacterized protein LOC143474684 isoform X1 [Brachyhypopomus gauderio]|uniref:uncharacterized protein LOC143474684 isoform X1 n=1 Tax=Brachyhypopomus gauderio TaxID=698409 RepID=UPI004041D278